MYDWYKNMLKAYKYRLYPDKGQTILLAKTFGCCRKIYNHCLDFKNRRYAEYQQNVSRYELSAMLTFLKSTEEYQYLNEVNSQALQSELVHLDKAFTNFFQHKGAYPTFKSKFERQAFACPQGVSVDFLNNIIKLPKLKSVGCKIHRKFFGIVKTCTVSKSTTNKYYVSVLVDAGAVLPKKKQVVEHTAIGIDMGIKSFLVSSDGTDIPNSQFYRQAEPRIKCLQRRVARKVKGSKNREKAKLAVSVAHEKIRNRRSDFLHKLSTNLIKNHDTIFVEDLNVKGMLKNHCLAKSIADVSWSEFFRMLAYKADWYGKNVLEIGRFEPSSKMCGCGVVNSELTLADRVWTCKSCGAVNQRDLLAAQNIKKFGLLGLKYKTRTDSSVEPVELSALAGAVKQEHTTRKSRSPRL
jgi:putative transposase